MCVRPPGRRECAREGAGCRGACSERRCGARRAPVRLLCVHTLYYTSSSLQVGSQPPSDARPAQKARPGGRRLLHAVRAACTQCAPMCGRLCAGGASRSRHTVSTTLTTNLYSSYARWIRRPVCGGRLHANAGPSTGSGPTAGELSSRRAGALGWHVGRADDCKSYPMKITGAWPARASAPATLSPTTPDATRAPTPDSFAPAAAPGQQGGDATRRGDPAARAGGGRRGAGRRPCA